MMLILLVPLATAAGNPIKISTGKVSKEPPPAKVFTTPAIKPAPISKSKFQSNSTKAKIVLYAVNTNLLASKGLINL